MTAIINIEKYILKIMAAFERNIKTEFGGWLYGRLLKNKDNYVFLIDELVIPKQTVTYISIDFDIPYSEAEKIAKDLDMLLLGTFHTHPGMAAQESGGDDENSELMASAIVNTQLAKGVVKMHEVKRSKTEKAKIYRVGPDLEIEKLGINFKPSEKLEDILKTLENLLGKYTPSVYVEDTGGKEIVGWKLTGGYILAVEFPEGEERLIERWGIMKSSKEIAECVVKKQLIGETMEISWTEKYHEPTYGVFVVLGPFSSESTNIYPHARSKSAMYFNGNVGKRTSFANFYIIKIEDGKVTEKFLPTMVIQKNEKKIPPNIDYKKAVKGIMGALKRKDYIIVSDFLRRLK